MTLANYLYALVYSDIYIESDWKIWGEALLVNAEFDDNTEWVYNVIFANSKQELFEILTERMFCENYLFYNKYVLTEIIQGYYYYQYQCKKISLYELLEKSGNVADAGEDSMGCEFFYDLLNRIDNDPKIVNTTEFKEKISDYFNPLGIAAMEQKRKFESATIEDLRLD